MNLKSHAFVQWFQNAGAPPHNQINTPQENLFGKELLLQSKLILYVQQ